MAGRAKKTRSSYEAVFKRLAASVGHDDARSVTAQDVVAFKTERLASGVSPKTVKDSDIAGLKSVFAVAVANRLLPSNPAEGIKVIRPKTTKIRPKGLSFEDGGARCRMEFPLKDGESILETDAPTPMTIFGGILDMTDAPDLSGRRVLVVEDDYYIAGDTAAALRGAGAEVLGPCPNEDAALDLLTAQTPSHAVLDLNLGGGGPKSAIARALAELGVPYLFLTGYDPFVIPAELKEVPRLQKPVPFLKIVEAVRRL